MEPEVKFVSTFVSTDSVTIPRSEYDDLKEARLCLDMIAKTVGRFGVDDSVCDAVFRHFGYKTRADVEAELKAEDRNA